ncbi:hypothetical protein EVAR_39481_1 [Eumeta japonica]|uniref:Uncharacterized protein n=1 Tax=Eumeta variegata TaxID=151549 RepID=A0A4C1W1P4_EUMVA|nr:hypothetical protein EVAR_39481_1 [Eumeta japonica]
MRDNDRRFRPGAARAPYLDRSCACRGAHLGHGKRTSGAVPQLGRVLQTVTSALSDNVCVDSVSRCSAARIAIARNQRSARPPSQLFKTPNESRN